MSRWHAVRIRDDLYRQIQAQAVADARSIAQMTDRLLSGALEQEPGGSPPRSVAPGRSRADGEADPVPARAPVAQRQIEGQ